MGGLSRRHTSRSAATLLFFALCGIQSAMQAVEAIAGHGTRPPKADTAVDCAMRQLTLSHSARLLLASGRAQTDINLSLALVVDALQYTQLCNVTSVDAIVTSLQRASTVTVGTKQRVNRGTKSDIYLAKFQANYQFYVDSANGSDLNMGCLSAPFQSVHRAVEATREARTIFQNASYFSIILRGGATHFLNSTIELFQGDSNLTIRSYANETAVISGGQKLTPNWKPVVGGPPGALVSANIQANFTGLFVNNVRQIRARYCKPRT